MLIDTHAHIHFPNFKDRTPQEIIQKALDNGVNKIINVASDLTGAQASIDLAGKFKNIWATVGIHPHDVVAIKENSSQIDELKKLATRDKVVAIGEIGLDYFKNYSPIDIQKEIFAKQIEIAIDNNLPIVIHNRDADSDTMEILKHYQPKKVVFHCYSSSVEYARKLLDLGYFISFTGNITFTKNIIGQEVVKYVPLDKIMVETDCPFLAPVPNRGKTNEPAFVKHVVEKICELKNVTFETGAEQTTANAEDFFKI